MKEVLSVPISAVTAPCYSDEAHMEHCLYPVVLQTQKTHGILSALIINSGQLTAPYKTRKNSNVKVHREFQSEL